MSSGSGEVGHDAEREPRRMRVDTALRLKSAARIEAIAPVFGHNATLTWESLHEAESLLGFGRYIRSGRLLLQFHCLFAAGAARRRGHHGSSAAAGCRPQAS